MKGNFADWNANLVTDESGTLKTLVQQALVLVLSIPWSVDEYEIVKVMAPCLSNITENVWLMLSVRFSFKS